jgi:phosphoribosyl 1,2-cyclic phosphodiesterase/CheY-like chemotaxis protein
MKVTFWGTRGSIATPGPGTVRYGGNTSCVQVTTDRGTLIILDCGTGVRLLGDHLDAAWPQPLRGNIFLTHTHWDHIQGFPFFGPAFEADNQWMVYGPADGEKHLEQALSGQMQYTYFPVELQRLGSSLYCSNLEEGSFQLDDVLVRSQYMNHPAVTLGYRLEVGGATLAYCTDHEPFSATLFKPGSQWPTIHTILHAGDRRHAEFMAGADLVIHDAQYTASEYEHKRNWGHSSTEYAVRMALVAGVKHLALFHHDPGHDDARLDEIESDARTLVREMGADMSVDCAREGDQVELAEGPRIIQLHSGRSHPGSAPGQFHVLLADDDRPTCEAVVQILTSNGYAVDVATNRPDLFAMIEKRLPDLVLLNMHTSGMDGIEILSGLRGVAGTAQVPIIMLTASSDVDSTERGFRAGASDYMSKPFTPAQLRARVSNWLRRGSHDKYAPRSG